MFFIHLIYALFFAALLTAVFLLFSIPEDPGQASFSFFWSSFWHPGPVVRGLLLSVPPCGVRLFCLSCL